MKNKLSHDTPPDFIGQTRQLLRQRIEQQLDEYLYAEQAEAPSRGNIWIESTQKELEKLLRSSQSRQLYRPSWPAACLQLVDNELELDEKIDIYNRCIQHELDTKPNAKGLPEPLSKSDSNAQQLDQHACRMLLPAIKQSFQEHRSLAPDLQQKLWMLANFQITVGRHLGSVKLTEAYPLCLLLAISLSGALLCKKFLAPNLQRRPDQEAAITWLNYESIKTRSQEFSLHIAKDWQLPDELLSALSPQVNHSSNTQLLKNTLEQCEIAAKVCLLYNQEFIELGLAQQYMRQWQLPQPLLNSFAPKTPR